MDSPYLYPSTDEEAKGTLTPATHKPVVRNTSMTTKASHNLKSLFFKKKNWPFFLNWDKVWKKYTSYLDFEN